MKLHVSLLVPMGCPSEGCDGDDFYILMSHPWGDSSKEMWVECNKCKHRFYTDKGVFSKRVLTQASALVEKIKEEV